MTASLLPERKRILYRAMHRGTKEADLLLGQFAMAQLGQLSDGDFNDFCVLLESADQDIFYWLSGQTPVPPALDTPVFRALLAFDLAGRIGPVRGGADGAAI